LFVGVLKFGLLTGCDKEDSKRETEDNREGVGGKTGRGISTGFEASLSVVICQT
jgi:hypothetical protein